MELTEMSFVRQETMIAKGQFRLDAVFEVLMDFVFLFFLPVHVHLQCTGTGLGYIPQLLVQPLFFPLNLYAIPVLLGMSYVGYVHHMVTVSCISLHCSHTLE